MSDNHQNKLKETRCPYLGLAEDKDTAAVFVSSGHYCHKVANPKAIRESYQLDFCLNNKHKNCSVFIATEEIELPDRIKTNVKSTNDSNRTKRNIPVIPLIAIGTAVLLGGLFLLLSGGNDDQESSERLNLTSESSAAISISEPTNTPIVETTLSIATKTQIPLTSTQIPSTNTPPPTKTPIAPTFTPTPPPSETSAPPTATLEPTTPPTETAIPPTLIPTALPTLSIILAELTVPRLNLRELPNTDSTILSTLTQNDFTPQAIGRNTDATWIKVQLDNGQFGWLSAEFLNLGGNPYNLPIMES